MTRQLYRLSHLTGPDGRLGFSKATLYRLVKAGDFPPPIRIGERISAWPSDAVDQWLKAQDRRSIAK
ncbi:AlpA family phage regulatory protein [Limnohabitans sp.]|uniref:helix-turn-helix transcriptional regulator n=1 Tax=Limnohabitans sp. TaxID=1907725 RepID=UPI00286ECDE5|nr:AlpA family phage regulatory protein [Limnohabitans sp.]